MAAALEPVDADRVAADPLRSQTPWHTPWMDRVLPIVTRIAERHPARTVLTRFIPPERPNQMPGSWRRYYERWRALTQERMDPGLIELVPPLRALAPPAEVIDKRVYSPFFEPDLPALLRRRGTESLVITGAETNVCVLAAVLDAVDFGYRVVLAIDALCSSSDETHDALLTLYHRRLANRDCEQRDKLASMQVVEFRVTPQCGSAA
jgi:nicotinamidase-related amidase